MRCLRSSRRKGIKPAKTAKSAKPAKPAKPAKANMSAQAYMRWNLRARLNSDVPISIM